MHCLFPIFSRTNKVCFPNLDPAWQHIGGSLLVAYNYLNHDFYTLLFSLTHTLTLHFKALSYDSSIISLGH
jgi:hypothetical protein